MTYCNGNTTDEVSGGAGIQDMTVMESAAVMRGVHGAMTMMGHELFIYYSVICSYYHIITLLLYNYFITTLSLVAIELIFNHVTNTMLLFHRL